MDKDKTIKRDIVLKCHTLKEIVALTLESVALYGGDLTPDQLRLMASEVRDVEINLGKYSGWSCPICSESPCDHDCPLKYVTDPIQDKEKD